MGEIVNLRRARKQRERDLRAEEAQTQRTRHGRTRAEKELTAARAALLDRKIEQHRLQTAAGPAQDDAAKD